MAQQCSPTISSEEYILKNETRVEHCSFKLAVMDFMQRRHKSCLLGAMEFPASEKDDIFTFWRIEINVRPTRTNGNSAEFSLKLLNSKNGSKVFARFCCSVESQQNAWCLPITIHSNFSIGDTISREFITPDALIEYKWMNNQRGLDIFCELTAFEQNVEEYISSEVKKAIPRELLTLSSDMAKLLQSEEHADATLTTDSETASCHKAVLVSRSSVLSKQLEGMVYNNSQFYVLGKYKPGLLGAILQHIYSGINDLYLKHTIPTELKKMAEELALLDLQKHIDLISSVNIATLQSMHITWKLHRFTEQLRQPVFCYVWPKEHNTTSFNETWRFRLFAEGPSIFIEVCLTPNAGETSEYCAKFKAEIIKKGEVQFEKISTLDFNFYKTIHKMHFITTNKIRKYLSNGHLILKCSLELFESEANTSLSKKYSRRISTAVHSFSQLAIMSLQGLSGNLKDMFENGTFCDEVIETESGNFKINSYILSSRLLAPLHDIQFILKPLDSRDVKSFICYLYSGKMPLQIYEPTIDVCQTAYDQLSAPRRNILKIYLDFITCSTRTVNQYLAPETYQGYSKIRNDPMNYINSPIYGETASNVENEVNRISEIFGRSTTITEDSEGKLVSVNSCNTDFHHPTSEADCEDGKVMDNTLMQHPSLPDNDNSPCASDVYNELTLRLQIHYFQKASYSYTIHK